MKIGDYVCVKANGKYPGQAMKWTENLLSVQITKSPIVLFHSSEEKITGFRAKEVCFHEGYAIRGYVYALELPTGTEIERYQGREVRVALTENMKIRFLGKMSCDWSFLGDGTVKELSSYSPLLEKYLDNEPYHWTTTTKKKK